MDYRNFKGEVGFEIVSEKSGKEKCGKASIPMYKDEYGNITFTT